MLLSYSSISSLEIRVVSNDFTLTPFLRLSFIANIPWSSVLTSTTYGFRIPVLIKFFTDVGIVAENNPVLLYFGSDSRIDAILISFPCSRSLSASSITIISNFLKLIFCFSIRSNILPGVATMRFAPFWSILS